MLENREKTGFHQNFNLFFDGLELTRLNGGRTERMRLHSQVGEGAVHRVVPRSDIELVISDYRFYRNRDMRLITESAMVELHFCLQGTREVSVAGSRYSFEPGQCGLQFMERADVQFEFAGEQPFVMLGIGIPVPTFHHFMEQTGGTRSVDFSRVLGHRAYRLFQGRISPVCSILLDRVMQSVGAPGISNLELEICTLELLFTAFRSFLTDGKMPSASKLSRDDMSKIRLARDIMMERMADPPTLMQLSRMIGINDYKLKIGFKEMYGATVFGYLRDKRLEQALLLLQQGGMNVNETSCAVGYSNPSYFAEAFREKYGINPGEIVRRP